MVQPQNLYVELKYYHFKVQSQYSRVTVAMSLRV